MQLKVLPWNCNLKMHRKISLVLKILASVLVCFICGVYLFWVDACGSVDSYGTGHTERIEIPSGMTVRQAAHLLKEKGLINNEKVFYLDGYCHHFAFCFGAEEQSDRHPSGENHSTDALRQL